MKCRNCGELIDEFVGKKTKAKAYLHVIKIDSDNEYGFMWGWTKQSNKFCRNPEPKKED